MSGKETWRNWAILMVLLVVFGLATALWSSFNPNISLGGNGGGKRVDIPAVPVEVEPIEFGISALGIGPIEIAPIAAVGILAAVVIVVIAVVGAGIAFINLLIARQVTAVTASDDFKETQAKLEQQQKARLKEMNAGRAVSSPDHNRPGWSAVSTSLVVLFFVWMGGMIINSTIYPEGQRISGAGEVINTAPQIIVPLLLIALFILSIRMRSPSMTVSESTDMASIPWDTIAVILLGLLVVGLGLAAMMFLLGPA